MVGLALVALGHCGGARSMAPVTGLGPSLAIVTRAPILYDRPAAGSSRQPFHGPLVRGTVNGRPTLLALDTGAELHVLDASLAGAAAIVTEEVVGNVAVGNGARLRPRGTLAPRFAIDGWGPVAEHATLVLALPAEMTAAGIGGIIGPSLLASRARALVLDLERGEVRAEPYAAARAGMSDRGRALAAAPDATVCRHGRAPADGVSLVVSATLAGEPTRLQLDTGSAQTSVLSDTPAGRAALARAGVYEAPTYDAAGGHVARVAHDVPVRAGEVTTTSNTWIVDGARDRHCGFEGQIGIDLLRSCVLLIGLDEMFVRCRELDAAAPPVGAVRR